MVMSSSHMHGNFLSQLRQSITRIVIERDLSSVFTFDLESQHLQISYDIEDSEYRNNMSLFEVNPPKS